MKWAQWVLAGEKTVGHHPGPPPIVLVRMHTPIIPYFYNKVNTECINK